MTDTRIDRAAAALCRTYFTECTTLPPGLPGIQFDEIGEDGRDAWRRLVLVVAAELEPERPPTTDRLSIYERAMSLMQPGEQVTTPMMTERLKGAGRYASDQSVAVAMWRGVQRGRLEKPQRGWFRLRDEESS